MTFKPKYSNTKFQKISIKDFIVKYKEHNPNEDVHKLKLDLYHFKQLKLEGETCNCGNPLWVIGSAISRKTCFTCLTGESDSSDDFEIE